jgi:heat shock protein HslJ
MAVVSLLTVVACERQDSPKPAPTPAAEPAPVARSAPAEASPSFVNMVWQVAESEQVDPGSLRVFLSDGTLVMASPHATPAFGAWRYDDGRLTITEEGLDYPTDILALSESAFRIRMHSPGAPVEILFEPAEQLPMGPIADEKRADVAKQTEIEQAAVTLWGTAWRLESLAGADVLDGAQATLEFASEGRASGNGSCNHFNGVLTIEGSAIQFGGLAATRKACAEAVMRQEDAYFAALREAERFEVDGQSLRIFSAGQAEPLRFVASQAPAALPANQISRATAAALPALTGIWTVVAHYSPGTSAMSDDQARARYGETVRLTAGAAISTGNRCSEPQYSARTESAEAYLASKFKLPPDGLKPLAGHTQIRLMEVSCGGALWPALGARLLQIDRDRALAPWDGVFFELARDRDFRAIGQEPGWLLEIRQGAEMRFTFDYGKGSATIPSPRPMIWKS